MKITEIIDQLCNHEISKHEAIENLTAIVHNFRKNDALEFTVEEVYFTSESNHGYLKLKLPYQYSKIEHKVKDGDKVDVILLP